MKLVVFGLTISSSWGNGHATLWRGLCRELSTLGHAVTFFERDVPYYAEHRDLARPPGCDLRLYPEWNEDVEAAARRELANADVAMVTSYCPDAGIASRFVLGSRALRVFYDMDTPVTLDRLARGESVAYLPEGGLRDFDLVLSFTGGRALDVLRERLGARRVAPLYGSVDPRTHRPVPRSPRYAADLSYLGTYAPDRDSALERLFLAPARKLSSLRFLIGGALYPPSFPWEKNIAYIPHVPPPEHPAFYCSSALTLNVTRAAMAKMGYCPSGRIFEAAACGVPILSDVWPGLDTFLTPGREILTAESTEEAITLLRMPRTALAEVAARARARVLEEHSAGRRARELVGLIEDLTPTLSLKGEGAGIRQGEDTKSLPFQSGLSDRELSGGGRMRS
jgi:spore maturation protein CgeB